MEKNYHELSYELIELIYKVYAKTEMESEDFRELMTKAITLKNMYINDKQEAFSKGIDKGIEIARTYR